MDKVQIYTDGACTGNPGKGGYAAVLRYKETTKEISCGFCLTTNNRMELLAAISALELLKRPCEADVYTDSKYLSDAVNKGWLAQWEKNGWKKSNKSPVMNIDLWQRLLKLMRIHSVNFIWVKGHAGDENNERCDYLAVAAYSKEELSHDVIYEKSNE